METEIYSSLNWALTADPTDPDPLFSWGTIDQANDNTWIDPELDLLLSASSYPFPGENELFQGGDLHIQNDEQGHSMDMFQDPNHHEGASSSSRSSTERAPTPAPRPQTRSRARPASSAKRGRPRKHLQDASISQEERRRAQIRNAQRAYRSRKEASVSSLKDKISQLEGTIKEMGTSMLSFGEDIVRSGALDSHPELLGSLERSVQVCLGVPVMGIPQGPGPSNGDGSGVGVDIARLLPSTSASGSGNGGEEMTIEFFIDQLRVTCCYQAYLVLSNPNIPSRKIERPFRFLLSLMRRDQVAEFFKDTLLARTGHTSMEKWDHVPLYRIGGVGTHYPGYDSRSRSGVGVWDGGINTPIIEEDSANLSTLQEGEEEWFDIGDLEGYLHARHVDFSGSTRESQNGGRARRDTLRLMQKLVRAAMCLGRSPGFRRRDVELAVDQFLFLGIWMDKETG